MEIEVGNSISCSICTDKFEDVRSLVSHLREEHERLKVSEKPPESKKAQAGIKPVLRAKCNICQRTFSKNWQYYVHFQNCSRGKDLQCYLCSKDVSSMSRLLTHYFAKHRDYVKEIEALAKFDGDLKSELSKINLKHLEKVPDSPSVKISQDPKEKDENKENMRELLRFSFDCEYCTYRFEKKIDYYLHYQNCYSGDSSQCYICHENIKLMNNPIEHYKEKHTDFTEEVEKLTQSKGGIKDELANLSLKYLQQEREALNQKLSDKTPKLIQKKVPQILSIEISEDFNETNVNNGNIVIEELLECEYCGYRFTKKVDYFLHFHNCHIGKSLQCYICNEDIKLMNNLIIHYKGRHKDFADEVKTLTQFKGDIKDLLANLNLKYLQQYQKMQPLNQKSKLSERTSKCRQKNVKKIPCPKISKDCKENGENEGDNTMKKSVNLKDLHEHQKLEALNPNKCKKCDQAFKWKMDCYIHEAFCRNGNKIVVQCEFCTESLINDISMINHYTKEHPTRLKYFFSLQHEPRSRSRKRKTFCEKCHKGFLMALNYELHYQSCFISDEKMPDSFQCHICPKLFNQINKLFIHYRQCHIEYVQFCKENVRMSDFYMNPSFSWQWAP